MPERASVFEVSQIGPEAVYGTAVAATKKLLGTTIIAKIMSENVSHRPRGSRWITTNIQNKEWTEADVTSDVAQYTDISYLLSAMFGSPNITTPGGGTLSREHLYEPGSYFALTPKSFTGESGSAIRAQKASYLIMRTLAMEFDRNNGVSLSGNMIGQLTTDGVVLTPGVNEVQTISDTPTVSGGTFIITFMGESTTAIAYNASAATIQTALEVLPNVDVGDIVVTGGPNPATDVVLTFGGRYASINVPMVVLNVAALTGGGTYAVAGTTAGVPLSEVALQPISADEWDFYIDSTAAGLGGTKRTRVHKCGWSISDVFGVEWVGNTANPSWVAHVDLAPTTRVHWTAQKNAAGMGDLANLRNGAKVFPRIKATGPIIEGALNYLAQFDFAAQVSEINDIGDDQGVECVEFGAEIAHDSTWAKALSFLLRNTITAIT